MILASRRVRAFRLGSVSERAKIVETSIESSELVKGTLFRV